MIGVLDGGGADNSIAFVSSAEKVRTWQELRRTGAARWVEHEVYAGKPKKEFIGPGLSKIHMVVRLGIDRGLVPRDELRMLRDFRDTGAVLQFTIGEQLVGDYVIADIDEELRRFDAKGVLLTAVAGISLEEYA